ncbi:MULTISPECIES: NTP transferase domain-containing protein [unclassified Mucilaginibacter]|jgi:molybdenum cofactor cytidylyltransferase|uniref:nucleotidyltransferase family protein n=1 Tax=unclassified Mucilaginibacter TaxID=2617802 RepID=UPI0008BED9C2|nr:MULTISPECIES: nucleotidyltransferase family protein [unclassified Mucilaginibacter]WDF75347.1 nucleotidyltransferase family protein [Mucilaginibacter sp. KACC 22773]SEP04065.1 molybdenum cofactor cytidylyltransferase [Mucilaginibacter sp. OK283]
MTGIIILAAGSSSRFGSPKQNLVYQGKTLLQRAIQTALTSACCDCAVVVLGANEGEIRPNISDQQVNIVYNPDWQEGMASSIRLGIAQLMYLEPLITSAILMLCDQPFVDPLLLYQLTERKTENDTGIIACEYKNTLGVPALFDKKYFVKLMKLTGSEGAKTIINAYPDDVMSVPFGLGAIDIDTIDDFERLNRE